MRAYARSSEIIVRGRLPSRDISAQAGYTGVAVYFIPPNFYPGG